MQRLHAGMVEVKVDFTHIFQDCFTIAPVIVKLPWEIRVNNSHEYTIHYDLTTTKQNWTKPMTYTINAASHFLPLTRAVVAISDWLPRWYWDMTLAWWRLTTIKQNQYGPGRHAYFLLDLLIYWYGYIFVFCDPFMIHFYTEVTHK